MLNYAVNACDAGYLIISPQMSVILSKWCLSWVQVGGHACAAPATVYVKVSAESLHFMTQVWAQNEH